MAVEIEEDRDALRELMRATNAKTDHLKVAVGWTAERFGRLKPNGRVLGYSPLGRVIELEGLLLGVRGKLALWTGLQSFAVSDQITRVVDLPELIERAQHQLDGLEVHRLEAIKRTLAN